MMYATVQAKDSGQPMPLTEIMPAVRTLSAYDKLRLIRILAEELEEDREMFPFEEEKIYSLPTPYDSFGAARILAEAMATYESQSR